MFCHSFKPSNLLYSQDSIARRFQNGRLIGEVLDEIYVYESLSVQDLPKMEVHLIDFKFVSADNRRLWILKELEKLGHLKQVNVNITTKEMDRRKSARTNHIKIRGDGPGGWSAEGGVHLMQLARLVHQMIRRKKEKKESDNQKSLNCKDLKITVCKAYPCTLVLLVVPLISLYFQFAVSAGVPLAGSCTNTTNCTASTVNSECKGGTCQCKIAFYAQNKTCLAKVRIGGSCTNATNCTASTANTACKSGTCQCTVAYFPQNNTCVAKIALGSPCKGTNQCKDSKATCMGTCKCKDGFYKDSSTVCSPRIYPNKPCGTSTVKNDSCVDNAYCNGTICACGIGYTTTPTSCNSAVTMAVVEISTLIMCFMLAYLEVLK
ncbi:Hypothetical predicted protein [Mytilus galloprovincialis]|uniref:EB domain-containing protein n=1 Tax=Mytilus galloprovincialis TaxID=29158 RepID=A0A8B6DQ05_MYTGA|nr:Hypothetical predicted protein [Mytilus galloprovincialis]